MHSACAGVSCNTGIRDGLLKLTNVQRMETAKMQMVRLMCGVKIREKNKSVAEELAVIVSLILVVMRRGLLLWFEHVERGMKRID